MFSKAAFLATLIALAEAAPLPGWTYAEDSKDLLPPAQWSEKFATCNGGKQSPILISADHVSTCDKPETIIFFDSVGCTISADPNVAGWGEVAYKNCKQPAYMMYGKDRYNFAQLHIHSGSEHSLAGGHSDAELHLVHRKEGAVAGTPTDDLLVIGVFLDVQTAYKGDNVLVAPLFDAIIKANSAEMKSLKSGKKEEAAAPAAGDISTVLTSPYELLPPAPEHFRYKGSLTTPPCSEIVTWLVMEEPVQVSQGQLDAFRTGLADIEGSLANASGDDNRPLQPLNGRKIEYCSAF